MTIVEQIDAHDGFDLITSRIPSPRGMAMQSGVLDHSSAIIRFYSY